MDEKPEKHFEQSGTEVGTQFLCMITTDPTFRQNRRYGELFISKGKISIKIGIWGNEVCIHDLSKKLLADITEMTTPVGFQVDHSAIQVNSPLYVWTLAASELARILSENGILIRPNKQQ